VLPFPISIKIATCSLLEFKKENILDIFYHFP